MKAYFRWLLFVGILALSFTVQAANHYVRSGTAGNGSGIDWTNAYISLPQNLVRGDTYYIADGTYGPHNFADAANGSQTIMIKKAIASDHGTDTGWQSTYGDGEAVFQSDTTVWEFDTPFYIVDGQRGHGKNPGGYGFRVFCTASRASSSSFTMGSIVADNITMRHIEWDWNNGTSATSSGAPRMLGAAANNGIIESSYFHHAPSYVHDFGGYPGTTPFTNWLIKDNYYYMIGGGGGVTAHWELFWWMNFDNSEISHNIFENIFGDVSGQTGWIMVGRTDNLKIHGNLFFCSDSNFCSIGGNGVIATWNNDDYVNTNISIYNNTFAKLSGGYGPHILFAHATLADTGIELKNNLYYNSSFAWQGVNVQNNEACGGGQACAGVSPQTGLTSGIFTNYSGNDFHLASATLAGENLGSLFNLDMDNMVRGGDGVWDRGAYEYVMGGQVPVLSPPQNLRISN
ncbi:MAG: hypothetical protein ACXWRA_08110 [Pseudobdellovibrionaceae bacterium]